MCALGLSTRRIRDHPREIYAADVSPELVSRATKGVKELVFERRSRALEPICSILFFDAIRVGIRDDGSVKKKAVYLALAIRMDSCKEALGLWVEHNEGSKFWLGILNEIKNRGVKDILITAIDGLTGFGEAINAVFSKTEVRLRVVHMLGNSLKFVPYKDRKAVAGDLKTKRPSS